MDQVKIGKFLKQLRTEKNLTQAELGDKFYTTSRTVSRWETGTNLPDLAILIELADFYDVDIREIIDGERKSENMNPETKDTLIKVAKYAENEKKNQNHKTYTIITVIAVSLALLGYLFQPPRVETGWLYNVVAPETAIIIQTAIMFVLGIVASIFLVFDTLGSIKQYVDKNKALKHYIIKIVGCILLTISIIFYSMTSNPQNLWSFIPNDSYNLIHYLSYIPLGISLLLLLYTPINLEKKTIQ